MRSSPLSAGLARRRFVRTLMVGGAASLVGGRAWSGTVMAAVRPLASGVDTSYLRLRLADFAALQGSFGSVRLGLTALNQLAPMPPFIVTRDSSRYYCVSAECTHAGTFIPAFSATGKRSICPNHGSRFGIDGTVLAGPATQPLTSYRVELLEGGILQVELSDLPPYDVSIEQVIDGGASRVAVTFLGLRNVDYEVLGGASAVGPWQAVSFATSVLGVANLKVVKGTGVPLTAYVERAAESAFFAVSAKVRTV